MSKLASAVELPLGALLVLFLGLLGYSAAAEQLPTRTYTIADGLPRDTVNFILRDSRGFLWFCSYDGLTRFDGYSFTNYSVLQGLPSPRVNCILEARSGDYWVGTAHGVCLFERSRSPNAAGSTGGTASSDSRVPPANSTAPAGANRFRTFIPGGEWSEEVEALLEDRNGTIWCGTHVGLFEMEQAAGNIAFRPIDLGMPNQTPDDALVLAITEGHDGTLWAATQGSGLYRRWPDGRSARYTMLNGLPSNRVEAVLEDSQGRLWIGTNRGLCVAVADPQPGGRLVAAMYTTQDGLPSNWISALQVLQGDLYIGTDRGLSKLIAVSADGRAKFNSYTSAQGFTDYNIMALADDPHGNIWTGSAGGVLKWARNGFTTYSAQDGLAVPVRSILSTREADVCIHSTDNHTTYLSYFDGSKFKTVVPKLPPRINTGWGWNQTAIQSKDGGWWIATGKGLCHFPAVKRIEELTHISPDRIYTTADGLQVDNIFRLFQDSLGNVWFSTTSAGLCDVARIDPTAGKLQNYSYPAGSGINNQIGPTSFCESSPGVVWIGFGRISGEGLARYSGRQFQHFSGADGVPEGWIYSLYHDRTGRLWLGSSRGGLARIDDPESDHPHFSMYTTASGLSSNEVLCVTEDSYGRIYAGTPHGVDRIEVATGLIRHYTCADGLAAGDIRTSFRDRDGNLWFGTDFGLSRFVPEPEEHEPAPAVFITQLRIAGDLFPVSTLGEDKITNLELDSSRRDLQIDFVAPHYGETVRYQYMLEGAERDWGPATDQRAVNYASLSPGKYEFKVRAVSAQGLYSSAPATVSFTILPPIWRRAWFMGLTSLAIGFGVYVLYRFRVRQLIEVERVRTRIATDLHDDIGASLSRIAILGEALIAQAAVMGPEPRILLARIAETARGLLEDVGDVIWSIEPSRDDLGDLVLRVREFATDVLEARGIAWNFQAPSAKDGIKLSPERRRQVYLIIKEGINNAIRHAKCTAISLAVSVQERQLVAEIDDDGCGFINSQPAGGNEGRRVGHGLENMRSRAAGLGGTCLVDSTPGSGTHILLTVPLKH